MFFQKLDFVGVRVMALYLAERIFEEYPTEEVGVLTLAFANMTSNENLKTVFETWKFGRSNLATLLKQDSLEELICEASSTESSEECLKLNTMNLEEDQSAKQSENKFVRHNNTNDVQPSQKYPYLKVAKTITTTTPPTQPEVKEEWPMLTNVSATVAQVSSWPNVNQSFVQQNKQRNKNRALFFVTSYVV